MSSDAVIVRPAEPADMQAVYMMGYDEWSEGQAIEEYLPNCAASAKYAKGKWYVLEVGGQLKSSLITYTGYFNLPDGVVGIGSVATAIDARKKGYGSKLVDHVVSSLAADGKSQGVFLYSDIAPEFYEKLGFASLPQEKQRYEKTIGMMRPLGHALDTVLHAAFVVPSYF